ncbi:virulence protein RhuM/Fic/DOC family protein [Cycloclasticus pugetii]|jgi:prophage maintenance system killer protein|uniref:virulence protein RhuM/Fic/DOC family protein n=1 Tax=Cycloclasticus pugetii TaxID=34068 RepID=UPI00240A4FB7|nr:virulence protein RhuM/Fic/DOC family protein [Cycloclasticus pugetii]MDF1830554.1 virulence protein RhuM/Fic/DOC family protein [Cycloclasticus pugetii]
MTNPIEIYTSDDGQVQLDITLQQDTLWLSQVQMSSLFDTSSDNISLHLKNIFASRELDVSATTEDFSVVRQEGKRQVQRKLTHYNLDAVISVGYRVNSARATQFRIWATRILKQHLVEGYTLNQQRLAQRGIEMEQALSLLSSTLQNQQMINESGEAVLAVISDYARSWSLLQAYDEQSLTDSQQKQSKMYAFKLESVLKAVTELKKGLMAKGEATELFGQLRGEGLASAIATIEQGFGDELFYPNVASRAANLLYLVIKNHPFADGNKRTGSFLFLWYLRLHQHLLAKPVEQIINDNTLVALALLVAESKPEHKELMIRLVEHFILLKQD